MHSRRLVGRSNSIASFVVLVGCLTSANSALMAGAGGEDDPKKIEAVLPKGLKMHRLQAGVPGEDGWYDARSTEGHFRVSLPIPFNDATVEPSGKSTVRCYMIGSKSAEGFKFSAFEMNPEKGAPKVVLKTLPQGFREKGEAKVSGEKYFQHQGHPAVEFHVSDRKSAAYMRYVDCGDRLFSLVVEYPVGAGAAVKPYVSGFFESLRIDAMPDIKEK